VTAAKVIDASAMVALLFAEPEAESVVQQLNSGSLLAPLLLPFEVANACLMKARRDPAQARAILDAFDLLATMTVDLVPVEHREVLELARELGAELITLDRQLAAEMARS
jgi:predicted nucleic acid-binding protein